MADLLGDMISFQFPSVTSRYWLNEKTLLYNAYDEDFIEFSDDSTVFAFPQVQLGDQGNGSTYSTVEVVNTFDPSFHLKLAVLEELPQQEAECEHAAVIYEQFLPTSFPAQILDFHKNASNKACELMQYNDLLPKPTIAADSVVLSPIVGSHEIYGTCNMLASNCEEAYGQINADSNVFKKRLQNIAPPYCAGPSQSSSGTDQYTHMNKPKRKRSKSGCIKNSEEVESQRQIHIAVERNRRKQMNEHLNVLLSLMPGSYVQRGDQASIIGGTIEFVKELEQLLQCLQAQKRRRLYAEAFSPAKPRCKLQPTFPTYLLPSEYPPALFSPSTASKYVNDNFLEEANEAFSESKSELAEVEVKMVGAVDAFIKILSQRRPGQLLKAISALESLCVTIVHLNITTIEQTVLYSFNVTLGADCNLVADEIATAVQNIFTMIHNSCKSL